MLAAATNDLAMVFSVPAAVADRGVHVGIFGTLSSAYTPTSGPDANTQIGSAGGGGNTLTSNGLNGILVAGSAKGSVIVGNSIVGSQQNGLLLNAVTDLVVGGLLSGEGNAIVTSTGYGVLALGNCARTKLIRNTITQNRAGNVNLSGSSGIVYVP